MPSLFPSKGILWDVFSSQAPYDKYHSNPPMNRDLPYSLDQRRFSAWSAADDMKTKAGALSDEAQREISRASAAAQAKAGGIELYSLKYYSACTFGGLIACVSLHKEQGVAPRLNFHTGSDTYCGHTAGPGQVSSTGRPQDVQWEL